MARIARPWVLVAFVVTSALPLSATASVAATKGRTVSVKLFEYGIKRSPDFVAAGRTTFRAKNIGSSKHEMVLVRVHGTSLPTKADGSVDESAIPKADKFGEIENVKPKKSGKLTAKLPVGDYVMFCNIKQKLSDGTIANHYKEGMSNTFTAG